MCAWVGACTCVHVCMYACVCKGIGSVLYQSCSGVCVHGWVHARVYMCVCMRGCVRV